MLPADILDELQNLVFSPIDPRESLDTRLGRFERLMVRYGDERARAMNTKAIETIESKIAALAADGSEYHYAVCWHFRRLLDLIRALD